MFDRAEKRRRTLRPVRASAGLEAEYRRRLTSLIDEMNRSVLHWVGAAYRANPPRLAEDASPAETLRRAVRKMTRRWQRRFDELAESLAEYYTRSTALRSDAALRGMLKKAGYTVKFRMTPAMRDVVDATINQNVALIKSIPQQYLTEVEGSVMRSVQAGRDLRQLTQELQTRHGVTRRRAVLIARDQNNKATAALYRVRQIELGVTEAIWVHSGGGKKPRPTHVAMHGKTYDPSVGMWDPDEGRHVLPGELINCRCVSRSVLPGLT